ncbi:hypothetical protein AK830_g1418 [Neonectria ditissima]|uniref:Apple domain-containing protein n=1 Tax=Neonectria ditissima TaxID=78410 RepID=A0A0P7BIY5_9HYPO|nr:hypothetical protein AK830_g1418 [Neonectria ditissima]
MPSLKTAMLGLAALAFLGVQAGPCKASDTTSIETTATTTETATSTTETTSATSTPSPAECSLQVVNDRESEPAKRFSEIACGTGGTIANNGAVIASPSISVLEDCALACALNSACQSFLFYDDDGLCKLLEGTASDVGFTETGGPEEIYNLSCFSCTGREEQVEYE